MRRILAAALALAALPAAAQSLLPDQVYSSLALAVIAPPVPVAGADARVHLAYELVATNPTRLFLTLDKVEAVDPAGKVLATLSGDALAAMITNYAGSGARLPPGGSATVFMSVDLPQGAGLPTSVAARVTLTRQIPGADGKPGGYPASEPIPATISFTGAETPVSPRTAVVIAPPLKGGRWLAVNGCCDELTSHRGAVMAINGRLRVPERFAIDWVQLRPDDTLYKGAIGTLTSYAYFGVPVYAVADGTAVNLYDQAFEQVPGSPAKGITTESIGGNMLVIDIGGGNFAFYAHLKPGSLKVKRGDKVTAGQVLANLGNTGNTDAPHLHFHVMDGPSPLDANGLPYVFTRFTGQGVVADASEEAMFTKGTPAGLDRAALAGPHANQLPLNNQLVDFGD